MKSKLEWKNERRKGEDVAAELKFDGFRVTVHRHVTQPGVWLVSSFGLVRLDLEPLEATTLEEAKSEGLSLVAREVNQLNNQLVMSSVRLKETA